jgi:chaperonin cofactor prefoldin
MDEILDYLKRIDANVRGLDAKIGSSALKASLSDRVEALDTKVEKLDTKVGALDTRLTTLDRNLTATRVELVDHMERIHSELTGRIVDLENPPRGNRGGNGGVPLAS